MIWIRQTVLMAAMSTIALADQPNPASEQSLPAESGFLREELRRSGLSALQRQEIAFFYRVPIVFEELSKTVESKKERHAWEGVFARGTFVNGETVCICGDEFAIIHGVRDMGTATAVKGVVMLKSSRPIAPGATASKRKFQLISWGSRTYLVEPDRLIAFCNAVNDMSEPRQEITQGEFLLSRGVEGELPVQLPEVPDEFRKYLLRKQVEVRITSTRAETEERDVVGVNRTVKGHVCHIAGIRDTGLLAGMRLYSKSFELGARGYITSISNDEAEVIVFSASQRLDAGDVLTTALWTEMRGK